MIDAGHGKETAGKRTPDGSLREYYFNSVVADYVKEQLEAYQDVFVMFTHSDNKDVPLAERTSKANEWGADLFVSIHANAFGAGGWNEVKGIETFVHNYASAKSKEVGAHVQTHLIRETGLYNRGLKTANFHVLRETNMPAILVECGFMTNKDEAELLKSDKHRRNCANAIVKGIVEVYKLTKKEEVKQLTPPQTKWETELINAVEWAKEKGISDGTNLEDPPTRAQLIVMLYRALK